MKRTIHSILVLCLAIASGPALAAPSGLNDKAMDELRAAGVDKYLGTAQSTAREYGVWTQHKFDPEYSADASYFGGVRADGPVCIAGSPYSVFTRQGDPKKLLIFMQGGGACWQGFYQCNVTADAQFPPANGPFPGVFDPTGPNNPVFLADRSRS